MGVIEFLIALEQIAVGVLILLRAEDEEIGRFGVATCVVGSIGLIGGATRFLRAIAVTANVVMLVVTLLVLARWILG